MSNRSAVLSTPTLAVQRGADQAGEGLRPTDDHLNRGVTYRCSGAFR